MRVDDRGRSGGGVYHDVWVVSGWFACGCFMSCFCWCVSQQLLMLGSSTALASLLLLLPQFVPSILPLSKLPSTGLSVSRVALGKQATATPGNLHAPNPPVCMPTGLGPLLPPTGMCGVLFHRA